MPLVSVKLPEVIKTQVAQLAANRGITAHAVMVQAIEDAVGGAQQYDLFVAEALQARANLAAHGSVVDGAAFATYLRGKATGDKRVSRPVSQALMAIMNKPSGASRA